MESSVLRDWVMKTMLTIEYTCSPGQNMMCTCMASREQPALVCFARVTASQASTVDSHRCSEILSDFSRIAGFHVLEDGIRDPASPQAVIETNIAFCTQAQA